MVTKVKEADIHKPAHDTFKAKGWLAFSVPVTIHSQTKMHVCRKLALSL